MLGWRAFLGYLPTEDNLIKKGFQMASRCCFCSAASESMDHLFVHCTFAKEIWKAIGNTFQRTLQSSGSLVALVKVAMVCHFSSQVKSLWICAVISAIWVIWHCRNSIIFDNAKPYIFLALRFLWKMIKECAFFKIGSMSNSMGEFHTLSLLNIVAIPSKAPRIISVTWYPPILGWTKVNTDGSAVGAPGCSGAGGIFRNSRGYVKGAFAFNT